MTINKLPSIILFIILCLFTFQAVRNFLVALQLNNADYFLQQVSASSGQKEKTTIYLEKMRATLTTVKKLTAKSPAFYNLQANYYHWRSLLGIEDQMTQAQYYYQLGLQYQPNDPYLLTGLANTHFKKSHKSILLAYQYAPSDVVILGQVVFWELNHWSQLKFSEQENAIDHTVQLLTKNKFTKESRDRLALLIKASNYHSAICTKLPRSNKFKKLCQ